MDDYFAIYCPKLSIENRAWTRKPQDWTRFFNSASNIWAISSLTLAILDTRLVFPLKFS